MGVGALAQTAAAEELQFTAVERATTDAVTDIGESGDSVGDILTFSNELFDEANSAAIGSDNGWCLRTAVGEAWECAWTNSFSDGQITVQGTFKDSGDSTLVVTGGSGQYERASGTMLLHARNPEGTEYDFVFSLVR
jgi:hypothetical protein